jgi:hypothetical protein
VSQSPLGFPYGHAAARNSACLRRFGDLLADPLFDARTEIVAIVHRCNGLFLNCLMMARLDRRSRAGDYTQRSLATVKIGTAEAKTFTLALVRRESDLLQVKSAVSQI